MDRRNAPKGPPAVTVLDSVVRAQRRVIEERRRAARAAETATRHERLAVTGPNWLRDFHREVANAHRQIEARHLVTAGIQASHVERLSAWATAPERGRGLARRARAGTAGGSTAAGTVALAGTEAVAGTQDSLTGLPNRHRFIERLGDAMGWLDRPDQHARKALHRVGVCQLDIDHFQHINDRLGPGVGDKVLVVIAQRLVERLPGRLVARLGGDEFGILVEDTAGVDDATSVAEAALSVISEPVHVDGHELSISASAGVVEQHVDDVDPTELMRTVDITLRWAKSEGRGRWVLFDPDRGEQTTARYALAAALPAAIARDELFVEFQPIVALPSRAIVAAEALVRWRHPVLGVLYPSTFVDLAERSDLIVKLGRLVLTQACREAAGWGSLTSEPPRVNVNIAARQLRDTNLVAEVTAALRHAGLPASRLQLEITEGDIVRPDDVSIMALRDLVGMGVHIAIDDFGTGYSNLAYLRRLPVQTLKIDRSFIDEVGQPGKDDDNSSVSILTAMIDLAHVLGLTVTAEGVETAEQAALLASMDCDTAQGWYFGRPTDADDFAKLLAARVAAE